MSDNPYTKAPPLKGSSPSKSTLVKEPLYGFLSRKVKAEQVQGALAGDINPFTKKPHSDQYKKILEMRKKLPVYAQMEEFYKMARDTLGSQEKRN
ncbi:hypothetical protein AcV7_005538 [Taiwanofungus camphoratus]|nr:hypothetical protein AcV7_005538 [Antrodia cinnamomea]